MKRALVTAAPFAWATCIYFVSALPKVPLPGVVLSDKVGHAMAYGLLGFLAVHALIVNGVAPSTAVWVGALLATLYGVSDEVHQAFVPGRSPEVLDAAADGVGAFAACALWYAAHRRVQRGRAA